MNVFQVLKNLTIKIQNFSEIENFYQFQLSKTQKVFNR